LPRTLSLNKCGFLSSTWLLSVSILDVDETSGNFFFAVYFQKKKMVVNTFCLIVFGTYMNTMIKRRLIKEAKEAKKE
jgi:hypothetical protein